MYINQLDVFSFFMQFNLCRICLTVQFSFTVSGEALVELLTALNDSNHRITDWNYFLVSPCASWSHVTCINEHVVSL